MDWELILSLHGTSAAISLAGVILSALIAKIAATKTAKITTKAEMERLQAEHAHADRILAENRAEKKDASDHEMYKNLISTVTEFAEKPDRNTKAAAIAACTKALLITSAPKKQIEELLSLIRETDAFVGVQYSVVTPLLLQIIELRQSVSSCDSSQ